VFAVNELIRAALSTAKTNPRTAYICPLYRQAKSVAWDYVKHFSRPIPGVIFNEAELRADYPNGGRLQLYGADNYDALRGIYLDMVVMDEYAQMAPAAWTQVIRPALADRQGSGIFIGTPCGHNNFYDLYQQAAELEGWHREMWRASETGIVRPEELEAARREMSEAEYEQEFECSWSAAIRGAYYGKEMQAVGSEDRITMVPVDKTLPVHTAWDLGVRDSTVIWLFQAAGSQIRLIDCLEFQSTGLPDMIQHLDKLGHKYGDHIAPHDINVRELGSGQSRLETARQLGVDFKIAPKIPLQDGIQAVRSLLNRCWFDTKCRQGAEALSLYRAEYDDKRAVFRHMPIHDWTSHYADAFRYLAVGINQIAVEGYMPYELDYSELDRCAI
jgi:hypothetical protein